MSANPLMAALEQFEAVEANLAKLERLWAELEELFPSGVLLGRHPEYEDRSRSFVAVLTALPEIDGWKPDLAPPDHDELSPVRLDLMELDDALATARFEADLWTDGKQLGEYRFRLDQKRREIIRTKLVEIIGSIDNTLAEIRNRIPSPEPEPYYELKDTAEWVELRSCIDQIEVLLGASVGKPGGWPNLRRHLHFGQYSDFRDIEQTDWPHARSALQKGLYGGNEPLPTTVKDLSELVAAKPSGSIITALNWSNIDDADFERLIFSLISDVPGYENPEWLTNTRAADRGRDLSVTRVFIDALSGTFRERTIIQCKHWQSKSVALNDVTFLKDQMRLWQNPNPSTVIIAASGRFTADAVQYIERHNEERLSPRLEMWPESHLERLLAARPGLIAEFHLR